MTTVYLSPIGNDSQVDANGEPYSGGKIYTYTAGSDTPKTTYTSSAGSVAQANPIILNSRGMPASPIWMATGAYKLVLKTSADVTVWTLDNISGINDVASSVSEWVASGLTPTYLSATTFSLVGDQTALFQVGRRIRTTNTAGTVYGVITGSAFAAVTTVTVLNDSGSLDSGLSAVSYGLLSATNPAVPNIVVSSFTATLTGVSGTVNGTAKYTKIGNQVTLMLPALTGASNSTSKAITGLPAALYPAAQTQGVLLAITDNTALSQYPGGFTISSGGVINLYTQGNLSAGWTNSGTCGMSFVPITYTLA